MDYNKVKELLDKYWEGETTLEEEQVLKNYFNSTNVAADFEQFKPLFVYFKKEKSLTSKQSFVHLTQLSRVRPLIPKWLMAAASILLFIVGGLSYNYDTVLTVKEDTKLIADTYKDPQEAYKEAKAALMLISKGLNKGITKTKDGVKKAKD
jgi:hypothetical protein